MSKVIYNVFIGGYSVGMTFKLTEAQSWVKASTFPGEKKITKVIYKV